MSGARSPEEVPRLFNERVRTGDLDALMTLYCPNALVCVAPDSEVTGSAPVRKALTGLIAARARPQGEIDTVLTVGDTALLVLRYAIAFGDDPAGKRAEGRSADVLRRGPDGYWRYLIDYPQLDS